MKAEEVQRQDEKLKHLAKYDVTNGWRLPLTNELIKLVLPRFREFKTIVMKCGMTFAEVEEWIYRKNGDPNYSYGDLDFDDLDDLVSPSGKR